jgi:sulfhydrogenase subunit delta
MPTITKPKLAVWKFASCDGCQLSLLDCEDELLAVAGAVEIANFPEATRALTKGPYDLSLVEGSITTSHDAERIQKVRKMSKYLITIGACATAGGIQALRNFANVVDFTNYVYAEVDTDQLPCTCRFRTSRLSDQQDAVGGSA